MSSALRHAARAFVCAALTACVGLTADAQAPPERQSEPEGAPRRIVDERGRAQEIRLLRLTDREIEYIDELGRKRRAAVGGVVALGPSNGEEPLLTSRPAQDRTLKRDGALETTDGQRFPGELAPTGGADEESIVWQHSKFGRITVRLDHVARAFLRSVGPDAAAPGAFAPDSVDDQLLLTNGDLVTGFVLDFGDPVLIEVGGVTISIPTDRVADARLANDNAPMRGLVVWLADGAVIVVASVEDRGDRGVELRLPGGQSAIFPLDEVHAIALDAGRLLPLAGVAPTRQTPVGERLLLEPVRVFTTDGSDAPEPLSAPNIELPSPMSVAWTLPERAARLVVTAELPLETQPWGDCVLTVSVDGRELERRRLHPGAPRVELSVPLAGRELEIAVEPGAFGPVLDRVVLRNALLILAPSPAG